MRKKLQSVIRLLCILLGVAILLYPSLSTYLSEKNGSRAAGSYDGLVEQQNEAARQAILQEAIDYNRTLVEDQQDAGLPLTDVQGRPFCRDEYWDIMNLSGNGMMGYIVLPTLNETIPIYHSTEESVLQVGIGHVVNTSIPVGGPSTHAALSGHRGLPSASLFTNLDQVEIGDCFYIKMMDQVLAYQVDQILTVLPEETQELAIVPGEDHVTLITCTPYGVNSHRLLVRGTRIPYVPPEDGSPLIPEAEGSFLAKIPMQYRHLMLGLLVILAFLLLRWGIMKVSKFVRERRR